MLNFPDGITFHFVLQAEFIPKKKKNFPTKQMCEMRYVTFIVSQNK